MKLTTEQRAYLDKILLAEVTLLSDLLADELPEDDRIQYTEDLQTAISIQESLMTEKSE